jgi:hypothetical protein
MTTYKKTNVIMKEIIRKALSERAKRAQKGNVRRLNHLKRKACKDTLCNYTLTCIGTDA